jgi:hypothetical protein
MAKMSMHTDFGDVVDQIVESIRKETMEGIEAAVTKAAEKIKKDSLNLVNPEVFEVEEGDVVGYKLVVSNPKEIQIVKEKKLIEGAWAMMPSLLGQ